MRSPSAKALYERVCPHQVEMQGLALGRRLDEAIAWCAAQLGEGARPGRPERRWASFGRTFYFREQADAAAFRVLFERAVTDT